MFEQKIEVIQLRPNAIVPTRGSKDAAGFDLHACIDAPVAIKFGEPAMLIPTGLKMFIKPMVDEVFTDGHGTVAGIIVPRSGLGHKQGVVLGNGTGLIDADYQGEWFVSLVNRGNHGIDTIDVVINPGDRIAQVFFVPVVIPNLCIVKEFSDMTKRGEGGFGSTGISA